MGPEMGHIQIFKIVLSDFRDAVSLTCTRDFDGNYFLESEAFKVQLMHPERLAAAGQRLQRAGQIAVARNEGMPPGAVWRYEGAIEIGINGAGNAVYIQAGALRIEPGEEQLGHLQFALGRLYRDLDDVSRASTVPQQLNLTPGIVDAYGRRPSW
jgi:hypothetical protein